MYHIQLSYEYTNALLTFGGPAKNCNLLARPWVHWTRRGFTSGISQTR